MKVSLNWLQDFIELDKKLSIDEIAWKVTEATAEIEHVHHIGKGLEDLVVGELMETKKHPEADKLHVGQVKVSAKQTIQVIYGDKAEVAVGDKVPTAIAPQQLHGGKIERGEIRGVLSEGMLCLDSELIPDAPGTLTKFDKKAKVGTPITELLPIQDVVFEIDNHSITHRSDLFSQYGFAREFVALGLAKWKKPIKEIDLSKKTGKKEVPMKISFKDEGISKNYYSTVVGGLSTKQSPDWVRARLMAVGVRPINAIVDISNLVMFEIGQPVHTFDLRFLEGKDFIHRLSKNAEEMTTLDGMKRKLDPETIVIESGGDIVDLCGIMGGENSAIADDTSDVYVHVCHYDNVLIRKAMISLGHRTDAGTIFEKNIEPERAKVGYQRTLELFAELFPEASFDHQTFHHQEASSPEHKISVPIAKMNAHLGIEIDPKKAKQYLEAIGFEVKVTKDKIDVVVPAWRALSVTIPEDVIEEVVRIHGYSQVPATPPPVELVTPQKNHKRHSNRTIQSVLTGQGFNEEANYSFLPAALLEKVGITDFSNIIEITNPVTDDFRYMRPNFLPYLLNNLSRNQIAESRVWKSFEMGAVYKKLQKEVIEHHLLTAVIASPQEEGTFFEAKGVLQSLLRELSLSLDLQSDEHEHSYPARCLSISHEDAVVGHVYELHPLLMESFKLKGSVAVIEVNMDELYQVQPTEVFYNQINRNPQALLDINVVVDQETMMGEIQDIINSVESEYLASADLVDIYEGKNLGEGKKSFTFALAYQHPERTLEEKEIQDILDKLIKALEKSGGTVRR